MDAPEQLIYDTKDNKKWQVNKTAIEILEREHRPVAVIAVVGKSRTGKSYFMNRLAKKKKGFSLGSTIVSHTKGIWMWIKDHPLRKGEALVLLDIEGLYDTDADDKTRDMHLFTFAVLLSNVLLYNTIGNIDSKLISELELVTKLTEVIKTKKKGEEDGALFAAFFPVLCVVVRDFFLKLEIDGKEVTSHQYFAKTLRLRLGDSADVQRFNAPRHAITNNFKERMCFTLPRPVNKDEDFQKLETKGPTKKFNDQAEKVLKEILAEAEPKELCGHSIKGADFARMVECYVVAVNEGSLPCIESAVDNMRKIGNTTAHSTAHAKYEKLMEPWLQKLPLDLVELEGKHEASTADAMNLFNEMVHPDETNNIKTDDAAKTSVNLLQDITKSYEEIRTKNKERSVERSNEMIRKHFASLEKDVIKKAFAVKGGFEKYKKAKEKAVTSYKKCKGLGPMAENILNEYLESQAGTETSILAMDEAKDAAEKAAVQQEAREKIENEKRQLEQKETAEKHKKQLQEIQQVNDNLQALCEKREKEHSVADQKLKKVEKEKEAAIKELEANGQEAEAKKELEMLAKVQKERTEKELIQQEKRESEERLRKELMQMKEKEAGYSMTGAVIGAASSLYNYCFGS